MLVPSMTRGWTWMQVLPPGASQADVYESAVSGIVDDVLGGFNGTIMAYGQVRLHCWIKGTAHLLAEPEAFLLGLDALLCSLCMIHNLLSGHGAAGRLIPANRNALQTSRPELASTS